MKWTGRSSLLGFETSLHLYLDDGDHSFAFHSFSFQEDRVICLGFAFTYFDRNRIVMHCNTILYKRGHFSLKSFASTSQHKLVVFWIFLLHRKYLWVQITKDSIRNELEIAADTSRKAKDFVSRPIAAPLRRHCQFSIWRPIADHEPTTSDLWFFSVTTSPHSRILC